MDYKLNVRTITPLQYNNQAFKFGVILKPKTPELVRDNYYISLWDNRISLLKSMSDLLDIVNNKKKYYKRYSTYLDNYEAYAIKKKTSLPSLLLIDPEYEYNFICADFDKCSNDSFHFNDFDELRDYCKNKYTGKAIFFNGIKQVNSFKMLFLVKGKINNAKEAQLALKEILSDDDIYSLCDHSARAFQRCYVTNDILNNIKSNIHAIEVQEINIYKVLSRCNPSSQIYETSRSLYSGTLPIFLTNWIDQARKVKDKAARELFCRLLLVNKRNLVNGQCPIPVVTYSKEVKTSRKTIAKFISLFIASGWLTQTSKPSYVLHLASEYQACGELLEQCDKASQSRYTPPTSIPDGQWNTTLMSVTRYFKGDVNRINEWFQNIQGHDEKDRTQQKDRIVKHYLITLDNNHDTY